MNKMNYYFSYSALSKEWEDLRVCPVPLLLPRLQIVLLKSLLIKVLWNAGYWSYIWTYFDWFWAQRVGHQRVHKRHRVHQMHWMLMNNRKSNCQHNQWLLCCSLRENSPIFLCTVIKSHSKNSSIHLIYTFICIKIWRKLDNRTFAFAKCLFQSFSIVHSFLELLPKYNFL